MNEWEEVLRNDEILTIRLRLDNGYLYHNIYKWRDHGDTVHGTSSICFVPDADEYIRKIKEMVGINAAISE